MQTNCPSVLPRWPSRKVLACHAVLVHFIQASTLTSPWTRLSYGHRGPPEDSLDLPDLFMTHSTPGHSSGMSFFRWDHTPLDRFLIPPPASFDGFLFVPDNFPWFKVSLTFFNPRSCLNSEISLNNKNKLNQLPNQLVRKYQLVRKQCILFTRSAMTGFDHSLVYFLSRQV